MSELNRRSYLLGYADGQESVNRWIDVKSSYPTEDQLVLTYSSKRAPCIAIDWYCTKKDYWVTDRNVSHWQDLPARPKDEV